MTKEIVPLSVWTIGGYGSNPIVLEDYFLIQSFRYHVTNDDCTISLTIGEKNFGNWRLFAPNGYVPVSPNLLVAKGVFFSVFCHTAARLRICIDGQTARELIK